MTSFFQSILPSLYTAVTENGAVSLPTSQPPHCQQEQIGGRLDFFFKCVRGIDEPVLHSHLEASWKEDPLDTLKIIFQTRDCRGGKGERGIFRQMLKWLATHHLPDLQLNLHLIPLYGRWDDLFFIPGGIEFLARQFEKDRQELLDKKEHAKISLAAKWAPTERHALDKKYHLVAKIVKAMGLMDDPSQGIANGRITYRKEYLTPLRKHLRIVERSMCNDEWEAIDYSHVPSRAMKNYKKAFELHDPTRFLQWKTALQKEDKKTDDGDTVKVNAKQLFPHELVKEYYNNDNIDVVTEEQWKVLEQDLAKSGNFTRSLCLCDVSSSMSGIPMMVSIAMGILVSSVTAEPFKGQIITFESSPSFHTVQGDTLLQKVKDVAEMSWGGSTNLQAAFDLILSRAVEHQVLASEMPNRLYIFSDMQFDQACNNNQFTNFETIKAKYRQAGYVCPQVIFWNLRGDTRGSKEIPVSANENGVALLSGFDISLLKSIMDGADITPWTVLRKILDDPRYSAVTIAASL